MSKPIKTLRIGNVSMAVWQNEGNNGKKNYSFTFQKSYKTEGGEWKNTEFFFQEDLMRVGHLINTLMSNSINAVKKSEPQPEKKQEPKREQQQESFLGNDDDIPF
jgi:hypothetical protein